MITLHHLEFSRSTRILWALEELELHYDLVVYQRDQAFRAPPALSAIHPLGKAPVIVDDGLTIAESGAILTHLNEQHGGGRLAPQRGSDEWPIHDEWLHFVEGSAAFPIMLTLIGTMIGGLQEGLAAFVVPERAKILAYVAGRVGDCPWLMGTKFTMADIQLAYVIELAEAAGLLADHPSLLDYLARLKERAAYKKAIAVGGPVVPPRM